MGFRLQQKLMTFNDLEHQVTALLSEWRVFWLNSFCYKVVLYLSYLYIKLDDKTKGNLFKFQAYFPIRLRPQFNWRLGLALFTARFCSYWDLTQIYGNERTCYK